MKHKSCCTAIFLLVISGTATLFAAPGTPAVSQPKISATSKQQTQAHFRRGPGVWRAFSRLSQAEKQELLKLQRTDPDKFRAALQQKADELYQKEKERRAKLQKIGEQYRAETDAKKKAEIKSALRKMVREDMENSLANMRRHIEESKQNIRRMENSLKKREANVEAVTDSITEHILSGKKRVPKAIHPAKPQPAK